MSYILEALRRAETERERKRRVPGLHTQPVPAVSLEESGARRSKAWLWVVVGVSAGVLLPLLWRSGASDPASEEPAAARAAVAGSVTPHDGVTATDAAPAAAPVAAATSPAAPPAAIAAATPQERPAAPLTTRTAPKGGAAARTGAGAHSETATRPQNVATNTTGAASSAAARPGPPAASASVPEPRLRSLAELPEELRRGVPQLAFGGSVYSEVPTQRMVIFNGQVLREGDTVTDDLLLEQIRPHSAVMRMRGQRFEIAF